MKKRLSSSKYDYLYTSKRLLPLGLCVLSFMIIATVLLPFITINNMADYSGYETEIYGTDFCVYYCYISDHPTNFFVWALTIVGAICGFVCFDFLQNEKNLLSVLSYGEKRKYIFSEKIKAFITVFTISFIIPIVISFTINISTYGFSKELMLCFAAFTLSGLVAGFWSFLCSGISLYLTPSKIRAVIYSISGIFLPSVFCIVYRNICSVFIKGMTEFYGSLSGNDLLERLFYILSPNILLFVWEGELSLSVCSKSENVTYYAQSVIISSIIWIAVCFTAYFVCKNLFIKKLKAENKLKKSSSLFGNIITGLFAMWLTVLISIKYFGFDRSVTELLIRFAFVALILTLFLIDIKNIKPKKIATGLLVSLAVTVLFLGSAYITGCFGYEKRVPNESEVESVTVNAALGINDNYNYIDNTFISKNDVEKVLNIHRELIETDCVFSEKDYYGTYISYTLKNGETMERFYNYSEEDNVELFKTLLDTDAYKDEICAVFFGGKSKEYIERTNNERVVNDMYYYLDEYEGYTLKKYKISVNSKHNESINDLSEIITEEMFNEIKYALYQDLMNESCDEFAESFNNEYGNIAFFQDESSSKEYYLTENSLNTFEVLKKYNLLKYLSSATE